MKKHLFYLCLFGLSAFVCSCTNAVEEAEQLRSEYKYAEAVELYQKAADDGDAYAMWRLANAYRSGRGVEFNQEKALELLTKAADAGCEEAIVDLGRAYIKGELNAPVDTIKGVEMIKKIVTDTKNPYVLVNYSQCLFRGIGQYIEHDEEKALEVLKNIPNKEDPFYLLNMGYIYIEGFKGIEPDGAKSIELLEKAYQKGEGEATGAIGWTYLNGKGVETNIPKGIEWLQKGVKIGESGSMYLLAMVYSSDDPNLQKYHNPQEALSLLEKSASIGNSDARIALATWYDSGTNVNKDHQKAFGFFQLADKYGNAEGTRNLAICYKNGEGCEKDLVMAEKLYIKAADKGNVSACIGLIRNYGDGVFMWNEANYKKYLEKAASLGSDLAIYDLGMNHYHGRYGYSKDEYLAFLYIKKGADKESDLCCEMLAIFYKHGIGCSKDMAKSKEYERKSKELRTQSKN